MRILQYDNQKEGWVESREQGGKMESAVNPATTSTVKLRFGPQANQHIIFHLSLNLKISLSSILFVYDFFGHQISLL